MLDRVLSAVISAAQRTPLRGRGGYSNLPTDKQRSATLIDKAEAEAQDVERFFKFFNTCDVRSEISGKSILDFGSGFGGRTVEYVRTCGASRACGVEPFQECIDAGNALAESRSLSDRVKFELCTQNNIPYENGTFDAVITFDVLEHVDDPSVSLKEIFRVLKPGGNLFAVFPVYRGALSHHLDYLTMIPGLHLVFGPERLLRVVNRHLEARTDIVVTRHDHLSKHFVTGAPILPMLNGMGLRDFISAISEWNTRSIEMNEILDVALGRDSALSKATRFVKKLPPILSEPFLFNVAAILQKPA